ALQCVEDSRHAFASLLRNDSSNAEASPNATVAEAVGAAIFEIAYERACLERIQDLPCYAYQAAYLALAPFLGVEAADRFVQLKLEAAERGAGPRRRDKRS